MPLVAYTDLASFKIYLNDVGLLRRMTNLSSRVIIEENKIFEEFKGALTENYVLQMMLASKIIKPNYFTFDNKYEIDYIIQYENEIIPIEVKSNENINSVSFRRYNEKYSPKNKNTFFNEKFTKRWKFNKYTIIYGRILGKISIRDVSFAIDIRIDVAKGTHLFKGLSPMRHLCRQRKRPHVLN